MAVAFADSDKFILPTLPPPSSPVGRFARDLSLRRHQPPSSSAQTDYHPAPNTAKSLTRAIYIAAAAASVIPAPGTLGPVMDYSTIVTASPSSHSLLPPASVGASDQPSPNHHYHSRSAPVRAVGAETADMESESSTLAPHVAVAVAPARVDAKNVRFELVSAELFRARLPMRVSIYPHDTTDSIVTTVKNFYGLYPSATASRGVSFEDEQGTTLIARYENFRNGMVVYVRVIEEPLASQGPYGPPQYPAAPVGAQAFLNGDGHYALPPPPPQHPQNQHQHGPHISRPGSRTSRKRSPSPNSGRGRRSTSVSTNPKARSRSAKNRGPGSQGQLDAGSDSVNGYSSGDGAPGSSSGKSKEHIGNTEISVENIVEGGRRKRAKFESSVRHRLFSFSFQLPLELAMGCFAFGGPLLTRSL